jgi:hypothetical protein
MELIALALVASRAERTNSGQGPPSDLRGGSTKSTQTRIASPRRRAVAIKDVRQATPFEHVSPGTLPRPQGYRLKKKSRTPLRIRLLSAPHRGK